MEDIQEEMLVSSSSFPVRNPGGRRWVAAAASRHAGRGCGSMRLGIQDGQRSGASSWLVILWRDADELGVREHCVSDLKSCFLYTKKNNCSVKDVSPLNSSRFPLSFSST